MQEILQKLSTQFQTVHLLKNLLLDLTGKGEAFSGESMRMTRGVNGRPSIDPSLSGQRIRYSDSRMLFLFTYSSCSIVLPDTLLGILQPYLTSLSIIGSGQIANLNTSFSKSHTFRYSYLQINFVLKRSSPVLLRHWLLPHITIYPVKIRV